MSEGRFTEPEEGKDRHTMDGGRTVPQDLTINNPLMSLVGANSDNERPKILSTVD